MKKSTKRSIALIIVLVMGLALLAACGPDTPAQPGPAQPGQQQPPTGTPPAAGDPQQPAQVNDTVVVAFPICPGNLSPFGTNTSLAHFILLNIYDTLFRVVGTGEVIPQLMESLDISEDGLEYTFTLRRGIRDTNGNTITAHDVLFSFILMNESPMRTHTRMVDFDKTEVLDDYTIRVVTTAAGPTILAALSRVFVISEQSFNDSPDELITEPVGTGPYMLDEWVQGAFVRLVANENYWGAAPDIRVLEFRVISEPSQRTTALMTGEVNFIYDYQIPDGQFIQDAGFVTDMRDLNTTFSIFFNLSNEFVGDINFRRAVAFALDNEVLTNMVYRGMNTPATTVQSRVNFDYTEAWEGSRYYAVDIDAARRYLAMTDYDGSTLVFITKAGVNNFDLLAEAVQGQLREIGISVEIRQYDTPTLTAITVDAPEYWALQLNDHSTFSNLGVDSIHHLHVRRNSVHVEGELLARFDEYGTRALFSPCPQERLEYSTRAVWLNQDNLTTHAICYATLRLAYADYISNINIFSTGKIAWHEIILG